MIIMPIKAPISPLFIEHFLDARLSAYILLNALIKSPWRPWKVDFYRKSTGFCTGSQFRGLLDNLLSYLGFQV